MLKNITWGNLLGSKTFWGGLGTLVCEALKTLFPGNAKALLIAQLIMGAMGVIGVVDRTGGSK